MVNQPEADDGADTADEIILFDAACVLRKAMSKAEQWTFTGSCNIGEEHLPKELYSFYHWVLQGPNATLSKETKSSKVTKHAISVSYTMTRFLSQRQINNKKSAAIRSTHEMPQELAVGTAMRQAICSKKIINRLLKLEGHIASTVLQRMVTSNNIY